MYFFYIGIEQGAYYCSSGILTEVRKVLESLIKLLLILFANVKFIKDEAWESAKVPLSWDTLFNLLPLCMVSSIIFSSS